MTITWISIKEGADLYGLNAEYFRREYCREGGILARRGGLRSRMNGKRRSLLVAREVILLMIEEERGHTA